VLFFRDVGKRQFGRRWRPSHNADDAAPSAVKAGFDYGDAKLSELAKREPAVDAAGRSVVSKAQCSKAAHLA
jgi:hypothetical protein